MQKFKILIVDDEILIAEDLKDTLALLNFKNVFLAHNKLSAFKSIDTIKPNLVLLDIRMEKEKDGLEIGTKLSENYKIPFIYITAHSDMAMIQEIIKTKPHAYITKPFNKTELLTNITLALSNIIHKKQITFKDGYENIFVNEDDILYIESESNYINIYCNNKRFVLRRSLDSILNELSKDKFFKIHRSYVVNVSKISKYSRKLISINNIELPISKNCIDEFELFINP